MHYTRIRTQLGNGGEVTKYLQQIKDADLGSTQVQFAIQVWAALKSENAVRFFNLLRKADVLQASLMHRYVGEVRLAVSTYVRTERIEGKMKKENESKNIGGQLRRRMKRKMKEENEKKM